MKARFDWSAAPKWRCPTCRCWVRDEIGLRCVECQDKLRKAHAAHPVAAYLDNSVRKVA
jgi:hypothetical protein